MMIPRPDVGISARIPADTKVKAMRVLAKAGLSISDLVRLAFERTAIEGRVPFDDVYVPVERDKTNESALTA